MSWLPYLSSAFSAPSAVTLADAWSVAGSECGEERPSAMQPSQRLSPMCYTSRIIASPPIHLPDSVCLFPCGGTQ